MSNLDNKLAELRKKWVEAKKKNDQSLCLIIERQAKLLKKNTGDIIEAAKEIFK